MPGWRSVPNKQRREFRRRNHIARDLHSGKYGPRIRESKRRHWIDEAIERDLDEEMQEYLDKEEEYWFDKEMGLASKE